MNAKMVSPSGWKDYELIDSGDGEKLERFGRYITARPEPQALWSKSLPQGEWSRMADAVFRPGGGKADERGEWASKPEMAGKWNVRYSYKEMSLTMRLSLTWFKHVGIFPEQADNWNFIYDRVREIVGNRGECHVLNLFAYTGGASLAARSGGASVTHVDSIKQVVSWARENMELSGLDNIRWMVDDALKFASREARRGKKYNGIILDPPAYGRGPNGERWVLEENLPELLAECAKLLEGTDCFLILNLYSMGLSAILASTMLRQLFPQYGNDRFGELYFTDRSGKALPLGVYCRFYR